MQSVGVVRVSIGSTLLLVASLAIAAYAALADDSNVPAPPVAVPKYSERDRHGLFVSPQHPRTRLVDGSGQTVWNDPNCGNAHQVDQWWLGSARIAVIDPPAWFALPSLSKGWLAIGVVSGLHIHFAPPAAKSDRIHEIVGADPSVACGSYCIYEEYYRTPGDPDAGGEAYWSRIQVAEPPMFTPIYSQRLGAPASPPTHGLPPAHVDNVGWPTPGPLSTPQFVRQPSFFPPRPPNAQIRYRTGVLTSFGVGMHSGDAAIRDSSGQVFSYLIGWPMYIEGKQTHCAIPPRPGIRFDPIVCDGGWPTDLVIGVTRVRVYYWHDVAPWGQHVAVTDQIIKAP